MTKSDLIDRVAAKADLTRAAAARVVDAIFDTTTGAISETVAASGSLSIPGFGTFSARTRAARKGRNPRTGETIEIPAGKRISFHAGRELQERVGQEGQASRPVYRTILKTSDSGGLDRDRVRDAVLRAQGATSASAKGTGASGSSDGSSDSSRTRVSRTARGVASRTAKSTASTKGAASASGRKAATAKGAATKKKAAAGVSRQTGKSTPQQKAAKSSKSARSQK